MWLYALVAALLVVAIGIQVLFLRRYSAQITRSAKVIMGVNIALLGVLLLGVGWFAYAQAVR